MSERKLCNIKKTLVSWWKVMWVTFHLSMLLDVTHDILFLPSLLWGTMTKLWLLTNWAPNWLEAILIFDCSLNPLKIKLYICTSMTYSMVHSIIFLLLQICCGGVWKKNKVWWLIRELFGLKLRVIQFQITWREPNCKSLRWMNGKLHVLIFTQKYIIVMFSWKSSFAMSYLFPLLSFCSLYSSTACNCVISSEPFPSQLVGKSELVTGWWKASNLGGGWTSPYVNVCVLKAPWENNIFPLRQSCDSILTHLIFNGLCT